MADKTALRAFRSLPSTICASCRRSQFLRPFSQAAPRAKNEGEYLDSVLFNVSKTYTPDAPGMVDLQSIVPPSSSPYVNLVTAEWEVDDKHKMHIYTHKHNTHLTLSKPNRDALISISCGNIGFRKAGRGTYDAAYQLTAFFMSRIQDKGLLPQIKKLELVYRGFGPGREAVTKAILGVEGKRIRPLIVKLSDSSRLKFGGTRSKKPRRLG